MNCSSSTCIHAIFFKGQVILISTRVPYHSKKIGHRCPVILCTTCGKSFTTYRIAVAASSILVYLIFRENFSTGPYWLSLKKMTCSTPLRRVHFSLLIATQTIGTIEYWLEGTVFSRHIHFGMRKLIADSKIDLQSLALPAELAR